MDQLKGNYGISEKNHPRTEQAKENRDPVTEEFERRAVEVLGGSIAFVMKQNILVWKGD